MLVPGSGVGDVGLLFNAYKTSFHTMKRIAEMDVDDGCTA